MFKTTISRLCASAALAGLLSACAAVGPDFKSPEAPKPAGYAMAGDLPAGGTALGEQLTNDWWTLFRSPEIDSVVRQAIAGNQSLQSARAAMDQARDAVLAQEPRLSGNLNASISEQRVNLASFGFSSLPGPDGPIKLENPTFGMYSFGFTGRYDFDLFGQHWRQTENLLAQAEAQGFQTDAALLTLSAQTVGQAIAIAGLKAQIAAAEDVVRADQANLELVTKAYQLGGGAKLDVTTVQTELATDTAQITPLRQQLAAARHALALLVGQAPADWTAPDFELDRIAVPAPAPVELPSELVRSRPDIRAAEARLHAATAAIGVAQADLYPKLTLDANIAQSGLNPVKLFSYSATGFNIGPGITLPILNRPQLKARKRVAEDAARQAMADYQQTVLKAFVQVADSLQAVAHDDISIRQTGAALEAATESLRLQRLGFQNGKTGLLPVLDAQRSYARAKAAAVRAKAQRLQDTAALLYAVSHNWQVSQQPTVVAAK